MTLTAPSRPASPVTIPPTPQAPTPSQNDALRSLVDLAQRFQTGERITEIQKAKLHDAQIACEWYLRPAGERALTVQLERLAAWAKSFNIPHDPAAMPAAFAPLAALPPDLLAKAFDRAMSESTDTFRLPMVAAIRAHVSEEMDRRIAARRGLHLMTLAPVDRKGKRTPEEIAAVDAAMAQIRQSLARGPAVMIQPGEPSRNAPNAEREGF